MAKMPKHDILFYLRRHFDQDTCNEDPQMVIDLYESDRRDAAMEIVRLRGLLEKVNVDAMPPQYDGEKVTAIR